MKRLIAVILVCLLCCPAALADWAEGRSPAQPYEGVPELDLSTTMGYAIRYPRDKMPASLFCDVVEIYLPREDIVRGKGTLVVHKGDERLAVVDFADEDSVTIEPLGESTMNALRWGGGVCVSVQLPVSLSLNEEYYITMDEGCFRTVDGDIPNPSIIEGGAERWVPTFVGDYGISALYYTEGELPAAETIVEATEEGAEEGSEEETEEAAEPTEAPAEEEAGEVVLCSKVTAGDKVTFDLVLGGNAAVAVLFSDNESVVFDQPEYTASATIHGTVMKDELDWGVVFLDEGGNLLDTVRLGK